MDDRNDRVLAKLNLKKRAPKLSPVCVYDNEMFSYYAQWWPRQSQLVRLRGNGCKLQHTVCRYLKMALYSQINLIGILKEPTSFPCSPNSDFISCIDK